MPTLYPKCSPSEMLGLLVLLNTHKGSQEVAQLADDLDLEVDEILPSVEFAEGLGLATVLDGRLTFTPEGRKLIGATIRERKTQLRELLRKTTLFRSILRAMESAPDRMLSEEDLSQLISFTNAPAETVSQVITWGRYTGLFRYDANEHMVAPLRTRPVRPSPPIAVPPAGTSVPAGSETLRAGPPKTSTALLAAVEASGT